MIAIGVAMDAFAVSVANGVIIKEVKIKHALYFGLYFGLFQFIMPILGWIIGMTFVDYISTIAHWVGFVLLGFIGSNMLYDSIKAKENTSTISDINILRWQNMTMLAIATSIDALAVGVSLAVFYSNILYSAIIIGIVAFIASFIGVFLGKRLGKLFKRSATIIGGAILLIIAFKILLEHIVF